MEFDISVLSEALNFGLKELKEKLGSNTFLNLVASLDFESGKIEPRKENETVQSYEKRVVESSAKYLFTYFFSNYMVLAMALSKTEFDKPGKIADYCDVSLKTYHAMNNFLTNFEKNKEREMNERLFLFFGDVENRKQYAKIISAMKKLVPFFENAKKIENICEDSLLSDESFLKLCSSFNKKLNNSIVSAESEVKNLDDFGKHISVGYSEFAKKFFDFSSQMESELVLIENESMMKKIVDTKPKTLKISESEQERLSVIESVNQKYDEFCKYTLIDLQKQVPYSTRNLYVALVDKFENFVKRFSMPLSTSTGLKQAKEVERQMDGLINQLSSISEQSTVSVVYGNQVMQ